MRLLGRFGTEIDVYNDAFYKFVLHRFVPNRVRVLMEILPQVRSTSHAMPRHYAK